MPTSKTKREFITNWTTTSVSVLDRKTYSQERFFETTQSPVPRTEMVQPDSISYNDLIGLVGKKTKVTIEVVE